MDRSHRGVGKSESRGGPIRAAEAGEHCARLVP